MLQYSMSRLLSVKLNLIDFFLANFLYFSIQGTLNKKIYSTMKSEFVCIERDNQSCLIN